MKGAAYPDGWSAAFRLSDSAGLQARRNFRAAHAWKPKSASPCVVCIQRAGDPEWRKLALGWELMPDARPPVGWEAAAEAALPWTPCWEWLTGRALWPDGPLRGS